MNGLTSCLQPLPHQPPSLNLFPICPFKSVHQLCMARALQISVCVCVFFLCAWGILCHDGPPQFTLFTDSKLRHKQNNSIKLSLFPHFYWGILHSPKMIFISFLIYWQILTKVWWGQILIPVNIQTVKLSELKYDCLLLLSINDLILLILRIIKWKQSIYFFWKAQLLYM